MSNILTFNKLISPISIEYKDGYFHVYELNTAISKHESLEEAQWIRTVLETETKVA